MRGVLQTRIPSHPSPLYSIPTYFCEEPSSPSHRLLLLLLQTALLCSFSCSSSCCEVDLACSTKN